MENKNIKLIREEAPPPGTLGFVELYALAVGQVIGAGVITLIVPAMKMTGNSAWLAYFAAIIMGFTMVLPWILVTSTLRLGGGNYSFLAGLAKPEFAGIYAFTFLLNTIGNALFGRAAAAYIGDVIPFLRGSVGQIALGVGLLTFFYIINLRGIDMMASAQKLMTWVLIAALFIFAVAGIIKMKEPIFDFTHHEFLTQGWGLNFTDGQITGGFFGAVLLFVYSCNGYYFTITYGRDSKNAKRDIPKAMLATVPTLIILYVGVAMAAAGMMTLEEYGTSTTLVFAAQKLFGNLGATLFVIGGPIMALLSTLNSTYANFSIQIGQSCKDGWLPSSFGTQNDKGSYTKILTFMYIVSLIPILLNLSITLITNMMQLAIAALAFLNIPAWLNMPKMYPKEWAKSKFHMPSGLYKFIIFISFLSYLITFLKSLFSMNMTMRLGALVIIIVCVILGIYRARKGNITLHTSVWTE